MQDDDQGGSLFDEEDIQEVKDEISEAEKHIEWLKGRNAHPDEIANAEVYIADRQEWLQKNDPSESQPAQDEPQGQPAPGEEQHWDFWRQEYQAGRMDQDELEEKMAPYIEKYGPEINEGIIEREEERIDAEVYPTGKGSGRCPDGTHKDPQTGQCKPIR